MKVILKPISALVESEYNPRRIKENQFNDLKKSLEQFGFVDPIVINSNPDRKNVIIGGHQRVKVAKSIGITEVPCFEIDLVQEKEKELNVRLNKNTGEWNWDKLANEFDFENLIDWGFDENKLLWDGVYTPTGDAKSLSNDDIDKVEEDLKKRFKDEAKNLEVVCPKCLYTFTMNEVK